MKTNTFNPGRLLTRLIVTVLLIMLMVLPTSAADWDGVFQTIAEGMEQEAEVIDISAYGIPYAQASELNVKYVEYSRKGYFPWYVRDIGKNIYYYHYDNGIITRIEPSYLDRSKYSRSLYERKVKQILDETVNSEMSQWQAILALHDYLATHVVYDQRFSTDRDNANYYGYDALINEKAVCEGYARAYQDLLSRIGIKSVRVSSSGMDHCWNLVQLNGQWYHVDVTWDDPSYNKCDIQGRCGHDYFMISDSTISDGNHNHYGWTKYYACTDSSYESKTFWNDVDSSIAQPDVEYSFLRRGDNKLTDIRRRDSYTGEETILFQQKNAGFNNMLYGSYGLSYDNGYVYFCDNKNVYAVSPAGGDATIVYTHYSDSRFLVGCYVEDGIMELTTCDAAYNYQTTSTKAPVPNNHRHNYVETEVAPTCQAQGYNRYICSCGSLFAAGFVDATGVHTCANGYMVTEEPDFGNTGEKRFVCAHCGNVIVQSLADLNTISREFKDVSSESFYYEPVLWAFSRGVTTGTKAGEFSPDVTCTRGQVVTFLWRAMGEPEPSSDVNPFKDIDEGAYYYKAVLWAAENGITNGMSASVFAPNGACTRGQVVTFLNRTAGNPTAQSDTCAFRDVETDAFYYDSVLWAVEHGVTNGVSATAFEPNKACSRGQIVTFLYRYLTN